MRIFIIIVIALLAFSLGFKVGQNDGYNEGFDEGYSYDCRAELGKVAEFVYSIKKDLKDSRDSLHVVRQNLKSAVIVDVDNRLDSLKKKGVRDTMIEYVDEQGRKNSMGYKTLGCPMGDSDCLSRMKSRRKGR